MSTLVILNIGEGDTKLTFDPKKPRETERAARIVKDLLRRGYALLVQVGTRKGAPADRDDAGEFAPQRRVLPVP